ncbi:MAG TPA: hypothetical protein VLM91_11185 [Candidatus Methylomirabilis sp.]|nr:hypothetical protein [Candidatus Methylomirabilis sp.]
MGRVIWSSSGDTPQGLPAEMEVQFLDRDTAGEILSVWPVVAQLLDRPLLEESGM